MPVKKQVRNRYTGAAGITQREADTILRCMKKIRKIAAKKNLDIRSVRILQIHANGLEDVLRRNDRL